MKIYLKEFFYGIIASLPIIPLFLFDINETKSFIIQLLANLLGAIVAGFTLYFFLQKRIEDKIKYNEKKRLLKNLVGDLSYNWVSAKKVLDNSEEYLSQERFTLSNYRTDGLIAFYYQKPYKENELFPYIYLLSLIKKFEDNNRLASLVFSNINATSQIDNKKQYFANAQKLQIEISKFLNEINKFYKDENIILTGYS